MLKYISQRVKNIFTIYRKYTTNDKEFWMPESEVDFVMQFEPLPEGTEQFDFIEPDGWQILNVRNARLLPQGITDTYWRNAKTGDWLIDCSTGKIVAAQLRGDALTAKLMEIFE